MARKKTENRKPIPDRLRFEVFKRDSFTCQYCGQAAPNVVLNCDHVIAVANGGETDILNLVTSCKDCNSGKSDKALSDKTAIEKQKAQLDELEERRQQLELLFAWKQDLAQLDLSGAEQAAEWFKRNAKCILAEGCADLIRKWVKKHGIAIVLDAMESACESYLEPDANGFTRESIAKAWTMIPRICKVREVEKTKPYIRDLFRIRGTIRNRMYDVQDAECLAVLDEAYQAGISLEDLRKSAYGCDNYWKWREYLEADIARLR